MSKITVSFSVEGYIKEVNSASSKNSDKIKHALQKISYELEDAMRYLAQEAVSKIEFEPYRKHVLQEALHNLQVVLLDD